jgi:DNA-binding PadR family transcriptional regulator
VLTDEGKDTLEQLDAAWGELESTIHTLKERRLLIGEPT